MQAKIALSFLVSVSTIAMAQYKPAAKRPPSRSHGPRSTTDEVIHDASPEKNKSAHDLLAMIEGFHFLLKTGDPGPRRDHLLLAEASAALELARVFRLKPHPTPQDHQNDKKYLNMALNDANEIQRSKTADASAQSRGRYFNGLALLELGRPKEAEAVFTESIRMNPNGEAAPLMSLWLGENKFDQQQYQEAVALYNRFFKRLTKSQKVLAIYKIGWCYINLQKPELAEKNFLLLAGKKWAAAFADDSITDLAFVMASHRTEAEIINVSSQMFQKQPQIRTELLTRVYKEYLSRSGTQSHPLIFAELMRIQKDPAKRLLLNIANWRAQQRSYASLIPYHEFQAIKTRMAEEKVTPTSPIMKQISAELEPEVETLIRSYVDTFSGRTKTSEAIDRAEMSRILLDLLKFHTTYFPKSEDRTTSYESWLDVCRDIKDVNCSYQVSRLVLKDDGLKSLQPRARIEWLMALASLQSTNPKYRDEYKDGLLQFYKEMPGDPQWLPLTKRLTVLLNEDKKFDESIPILKQIDDKEKTSESRQRLLWALYQSQQYDQVTALGVRPGKDKFADDADKLVREAHLRIASQEIEKNDFEAYEKNIKEYIAGNNDKAKTALVQRDYFNRSLDRGETSRVDEFLSQLPPAKRFTDPYKSLTTRLLDIDIKSGKFDEAAKIASKGVKPDQFKDFEFDRYQILLGLNRPITRTEFQRIKSAPPRISSYVLGILTLTRPKESAYYYSQQPQLKAADKRMYLLSLQMASASLTPKLTRHVREALLSVLPKEMLDPATTPAENKIRAIVLPKGAVSEKRLAKLAELTRQSRAAVMKELENKSLPVQKRILTSAQTLEEGIAGLISNAPAPANLPEQQKVQYQNGVKELAGEFTNQAAEYHKLLQVIDQKIQTEQQQRADRIAKIDPAGSVRSSDTKTAVQSLLDKKNFSGALVTIDRANALGVLKPEEFSILRSWVLISENPSDFMKEYVRGELIEAKQDGLLDKWEAK